MTTERPVFQEVNTPEEAKKFLEEKVRIVNEARNRCDMMSLRPKQYTVSEQEAAYRRWMIMYGRALGGLETLMHCRKIDDTLYNEMREQIMRTAVPTRSGIIV